MTEGDTSAQIDLEELDTFLQNLATDKDDDQRKPVESKESPEYLARSLTAEEAENLLRTFANGSKDDDHREPSASEAEDPLVSLVTQQDPLPTEDLIKMFPEEYLTTATASEGFKKLLSLFLNTSNLFLDPKATPPQDGIDALMNFANNDQGM